MGDFTVWASAPNAPLIVCQNAQVPGGNYPEGSSDVTSDKYGQFGWDVGINYASVEVLATALEQQASQRGGKVSRLAICVHGQPGRVDMNGKIAAQAMTQTVTIGEAQAEINEKTFSEEKWDQYAPALKKIATFLTQEATVLFMSCNMGASLSGSNLLRRLSSEIFPGRRVVGFIQTGNAPGVIKVGEHCQLPGLKMTDATTTSWSQKEYDRRAIELQTRPWASETTNAAKIALNGNLVKDPESISVENILKGRWALEIGDWKGVLVIEVAGRDVNNQPMKSGYVYWQGNLTAPRHYGKWTLNGDKLTWQFDDDDPQWKRTFVTKLDLANTALNNILNGEVIVNNRNSGFFKIVNNR